MVRLIGVTKDATVSHAGFFNSEKNSKNSIDVALNNALSAQLKHKYQNSRKELEDLEVMSSSFFQMLKISLYQRKNLARFDNVF